MATLGERARTQVKNIRALKQEALKFLKGIGADTDQIEKEVSERSGDVFPLRCSELRQLRVAAIMDRFTLDSYSPECELLEITPEGWRLELEQFQPDLLFVESAWKGKDDLWFRKIAHGSKELFALTDYCHEKKIPVVFWNKEDPVYTDTFMAAAHAADYVFTTDIDCVEKYKTNLGHDRVYHLHFAAQPKLHNPVEKFDRKQKFCFAGAYYHRYPKRAQVFDEFAQVFARREGLEIYDRNYGNALPEHAFPKSYDPIILGKLDPSEIDIAYKGYVYGINMNSVNQSQTMFARRVFEMLASNTITVGNYSRGLKNYFGDLTICTDSAKTLERDLARFAGDPVTARKYRLLGLRSVLREHLYEDRLSYIVEKVYGKSIKWELPGVCVVAKAETEEQAQRLIRMFTQQSYARCRMILFADQVKSEQPQVQIFPVEQAEKSLAEELVKQDEYAAFFSAVDWYGENYLLDLMLTLRYRACSGIGKTAVFYKGEDGICRKDADTVYKPASELVSTSSVLSRALCAGHSAAALCDGLTISGESLFGVDEFNYCRGFDGEVCEQAQDLVVADQGITLQNIQSAAGRIKPVLMEETDDARIMTKDQIAKIAVPKDGTLAFSVSNDGAELVSTLPEGQHTYIYHSERIPVQNYIRDGKLPVLFRGVSDLDLICVCICYDKSGKKIAPLYPKLNRAEQLELPANTETVQIGFRPKGPGKAVIKNISIGHTQTGSALATFLSRSDTLVLSNHYPSYDDLYRNMFVHKRMTAYQGYGSVFDVFRMNIYAKDGFREFEGINVIEGHADALESVLSSGAIKTVCVHFLDEGMWSVLKHHLDHVQLIVWIHGFEVQPWWRRKCNYTTEAEVEAAKKTTEKMMSFWSEVFAFKAEKPIHYVFVSKYLADSAMEDHKITLKQEQYSVIHNCIDTEMFTYEPKNSAQRKRILSIRPFAGPIYGNDITTKAIVELSKDPVFKDLEFFIYGDGKDFEKDTAPLKNLGKNVHLHKTFLQQSEIAQLHKTCGVFLSTKRMDTQGVSRDEAMSSGLVPIASDVAAVPEFVDGSCGILTPGEEYKPVAEAIKRLYHDPELFEQLSENAAKRVRSQTGRPYTIAKELELICREK